MQQERAKDPYACRTVGKPRGVGTGGIDSGPARPNGAVSPSWCTCMLATPKVDHLAKVAKWLIDPPTQFRSQ